MERDRDHAKSGLGGESPLAVHVISVSRERTEAYISTTAFRSSW